MKIELKNLKHAEFASQETNCFTASVYIDGTLALTADNDGRGGDTCLWEKNRGSGALAKLESYAATIPPRKTPFKDPKHPTGFFHYQMTASGLVDELVTQNLMSRDMRKALKRTTVFALEWTTGTRVREMVKLPWNDENKSIARAYLNKHYPDGYIVLNDLPEEEAFLIWKESEEAA